MFHYFITHYMETTTTTKQTVFISAKNKAEFMQKAVEANGDGFYGAMYKFHVGRYIDGLPTFSSPDSEFNFVWMDCPMTKHGIFTVDV